MSAETGLPSPAPFGEAFDLMGDASLTVLPTPGQLSAVSMLVRRREAPPSVLVGDLTYAEELLYRDQTSASRDGDLLPESVAKVRAPKETMLGLAILPAHNRQAADKLGWETEMLSWKPATRS